MSKSIPKGDYCYDEYGTCKYWGRDNTKCSQENGYCLYLKRGDWELDWTSYLWDMVKECDVNRED